MLLRGAHFWNFLSEQAGRYIFCTVFQNIKKCKFFSKLDHAHRPSLACHLPCLLNFADQAGWSKLGRQGGLSDQKTEMGFIIRVEKLSFWESASKIHDVAGTPTTHPMNLTTDLFLPQAKNPFFSTYIQRYVSYKYICTITRYFHLLFQHGENGYLKSVWSLD